MLCVCAAILSRLRPAPLSAQYTHLLHTATTVHNCSTFQQPTKMQQRATNPQTPHDPTPPLPSVRHYMLTPPCLLLLLYISCSKETPLFLLALSCLAARTPCCLHAASLFIIASTHTQPVVHAPTRSNTHTTQQQTAAPSLTHIHTSNIPKLFESLLVTLAAARLPHQLPECWVQPHPVEHNGLIHLQGVLIHGGAGGANINGAQLQALVCA